MFWLHYFNVHLTWIHWGFIIFLGKYQIIVKYIYSSSQCLVRLRNLIKTSDTKIGLAYSLLCYDIINLLNCKPDLIFIVYSQRSHYIVICYILGSLCQNNFTEYGYRPNILCLVCTLKILSAFAWLCCYFGLIFIETFLD